MITVGLVTTWQEKCGVATHSENVVKSLPEVNWAIIGRKDWPEMVQLAKGCDVVHIMHQGALFSWLTPEIVRACGKTVLTQLCIGHQPTLDAATVKTAQLPIPGSRLIPHGIIADVANLSEETMDKTLGCAGVPFEGKGHFEAAQIAELAGWGINIVVPDNPHTARGMAQYIEDWCQERSVLCEIHTDWMSEADVIRMLSRNEANVFYYTRQANGVSGAVRLGLAARRPVIVSQQDQFADVIGTGHVAVAQSLEHAAELLIGPLPDPSLLVDEWSYRKTSLEYLKIYEGLV